MSLVRCPSATSSGRVAWYKNRDGKGNFGPPRTISTIGRSFSSVYGVDLDSDGDTDVHSASFETIAWYENLDG